MNSRTCRSAPAAPMPASVSRWRPARTASAWCGAWRARRPSAPASGPATSSSRSTASRSIRRDLDARDCAHARARRQRHPAGGAPRRGTVAARVQGRARARAAAKRRGRAADARLWLSAHHQLHRYHGHRARAGGGPPRAHARSGRLKGLVIDLRNNPGGVLDAAVQIADDFLDHGTIVSAEGRAADANFRIEAQARRHHQRRQAGAAGQRRLGLRLRDSRRRAARQSVARR